MLSFKPLKHKNLSSSADYLSQFFFSERISALFALQLLPNRRSIEYDVIMSYESSVHSNFQMALLKLTFNFKINLETCTSLCMCCIFSFPDMYLLELEIIFPSHVQILHVQTPLGKILMSSVIRLITHNHIIFN